MKVLRTCPNCRRGVVTGGYSCVDCRGTGILESYPPPEAYLPKKDISECPYPSQEELWKMAGGK